MVQLGNRPEINIKRLYENKKGTKQNWVYSLLPLEVFRFAVILDIGTIGRGVDVAPRLPSLVSLNVKPTACSTTDEGRAPVTGVFFYVFRIYKVLL